MAKQKPNKLYRAPDTAPQPPVVRGGELYVIVMPPWVVVGRLYSDIGGLHVVDARDVTKHVDSAYSATRLALGGPPKGDLPKWPRVYLPYASLNMAILCDQERWADKL